MFFLLNPVSLCNCLMFLDLSSLSFSAHLSALIDLYWLEAGAFYRFQVGNWRGIIDASFEQCSKPWLVCFV